MYTDIKHVQILIALLKKYGIRHLVLSPGTRNLPLVHSVENDSDFTCYSIVDERSAAFFAIGLIQELRQPVAICCTSSTASCNYHSAIAEAFYRTLPLVVLTADRNPHFLNQREEQQIPQENMYSQVVKKSVTLPFVKDQDDYSFCVRIVNDALLELDHHGKGPVHINFPVYLGIGEFNTPSLPEVRKIDRLMFRNADKELWAKKLEILKKSKAVMVSFGVNTPLDDDSLKAIQKFAKTFNCVMMVDQESNYKGVKSVNSFAMWRCASGPLDDALFPEILITIYGNTTSEIKNHFKDNPKAFSHWHVAEDGAIADEYRHLDTVFECSPIEFFEYCNQQHLKTSDDSYYQAWKARADAVFIPDLPFSEIYAVQQYMKALPNNAIFHVANSSAILLAENFPLVPGIDVYSNRGTIGIDGTLSTFVGQSLYAQRPCYLLIGDLSFFYDMNGLWNQYVGSNIKILMINNCGGGLFYWYPGENISSDIHRHTAAGGNPATAKPWVESRGFKYLSASNQAEFDAQLPLFMAQPTGMPVFFEVFTDKAKDATVWNSIAIYNKGLARKKLEIKAPEKQCDNVQFKFSIDYLDIYEGYAAIGGWAVLDGVDSEKQKILILAYDDSGESVCCRATSAKRNDIGDWLGSQYYMSGFDVELATDRFLTGEFYVDVLIEANDKVFRPTEKTHYILKNKTRTRVLRE